MGHYRHHRQQNMKIFTAGIILLLTGSGWATPQFKFNLGGLFGGVTVPRNNNNQENTNTNNPLQAAGTLFGGALKEILTNTDVSYNNNNQENTNTNNPLQAAGSLLGGALEEILANTDVRIGPDGIKEVNQDSACPPLLGEPAPPGCNKTFVQESDGIPCWDDTDCPNRNDISHFTGTCWVWGDGTMGVCQQIVSDPIDAFSGSNPRSTSPISCQSTQTNTCSHCSQTTCPSAKPCRRGAKCYRPHCNRRGRCWCRN